MPADRRYTEAELHAIFERAAKRQEEARRAEAASHGGLTLAELQEIGEASGIDPAHVAAAAAELSAPKPEGEKGPPWTAPRGGAPAASRTRRGKRWSRGAGAS